MALWRRSVSWYLGFAALCLVAPAIEAATVWNESTNGDLSNNQSAPSAATMASGVNSVIGDVGGGDLQDWLKINIPAGQQLSSFLLKSYQSSDAQGFTGVQAGTAFVGDPDSD